MLVAFVPLTTYTLLILFRNIVAGFQGVPRDVLEAADAMGYRSRERLLRVELPLAVPLMITGIRLAAVTLIGLATVASILGSSFGGLGQLITEGLQTFFPTKYVLGAVLSVLLAFVVDFGLVRVERLSRPGRGPARSRRHHMNEAIAWFTDPANWQGETGIPFRLLEHLAISRVSILAATLIALPIGLYIGHTGRGAHRRDQRREHRPRRPLVRGHRDHPADLAPAVPGVRPRPDPDLRRDGPAGDPADPRQRLRGPARGRPRPRRVGARHGPARAPDPVAGRGPARVAGDDGRLPDGGPQRHRHGDDRRGRQVRRARPVHPRRAGEGHRGASASCSAARSSSRCLRSAIDLLLSRYPAQLARRADPELPHARGLRELAEVPVPSGMP